MVKFAIIAFSILLPFYYFGQDYSVSTVNTNLGGSVYSASFYEGKLVVCSNQKDRVGKTVIDRHGQEPIDLYVIDPASSEDYDRFERVFRTNYHDGPITFSSNDSLCILSRNLKTQEKYSTLRKEQNLLGLFESRIVNGKWIFPKPLPFNDSSYNCSHPVLNSVGDEIIFTSNMPGGFGGYDLWRTIRVNGTWSTPVNMGENINSSLNELFPTIVGKKLYFSSNRKGFGGLDIYVGCVSDPNCNVRLLAEPLNSNKDDFSLISNDNMSSGYFTSNRDGIDQLWSFESQFPIFENCDSLIVDDFCYTLYEENAHDLGGVESLVYEWDINGVKRRGIEVDYCFPGPGDYEISVDIIDTIINIIYANQDYFYLNIAYEEQPYISAPKVVKPGEVFSINADKTNLPGMTIDEYYWMLSDGSNFKTKTAAHSFDQIGEYEIKLGVIGSNEDGEVRDCVYRSILCSEENVDTLLASNKNLVLDKTENSGLIIEEDIALKSSNDSITVVHRIQIAESEEELPIDDSLILLVEDKYEVMLERSKDSTTFSYYVGEWSEITEAHSTWRELVVLGVDDAEIVSVIKDSIDGIPLNNVFTLANINFDVNKWDIRPESEKNIQIILKILTEHPELRLAIGAHTDADDTYERNMSLSIKRAESIFNYLVKAGIDPERMHSTGYGESEPIDTNETEEGRQNNRRVEFKLFAE
jgi:outer membrane protein OmpA-like peptidoglycan-associated protein